MGQNVVINELMSANRYTIPDQDGDYSDWIEIYNNSSSDFNLFGYTISDDSTEADKWTFPAIVLPSNDYLLLFASGKDRTATTELHTNFKIKSDGEIVTLFNPNGIPADGFEPIVLSEDMSYGRLADGTGNIGLLTAPTPGATNNGQHFIHEMNISHSSGFYPDAFNLSITSPDSVYYTTNGSAPTPYSAYLESPFHVSSIFPNSLSLIPTTYLPFEEGQWPNEEFGFQAPENEINKAVILKARSFRNGVATSEIYARTFFVKNPDYSLPVFSIITDSLNLFDFDSGIYVTGTQLDSTRMSETGNYYESSKDWERPAYIEMFEKNGNLSFSDRIGLRIAGNGTRSMPQKSLRFYWRDEYGNEKIDYPFFTERSYYKYKRLVLRSSFTYWYWSGGKNTLFQDDILHTILFKSEANLDVQLSRPSLVFINGEYWGIHNMRESHDNHYLSALSGIDKDSIDIIDGDRLTVEEGSSGDFLALMEFIQSNDLSVASSYEYVLSKIDLENYMDYFIAETYFGNLDWPVNNVKIWKSQRQNAKWRWLLFDLDGAIPDNLPDPFEFLDDTTETQAYILNKLLTNHSFKEEFINRYVFHLRTTFHPHRIEEFIDNFKTMYAKEVGEHIERWGNPKDYQSWENSCTHFQNFIHERPCVIKSILKQRFGMKEIDDFFCDFESTEIKLDFYPNPNNGNFTVIIDNPILVDGNLTIKNTFGQSVYSQKLRSASSNLNLTHLSAGVYFTRVDKGNIYQTGKVVVYD